MSTVSNQVLEEYLTLSKRMSEITNLFNLRVNYCIQQIAISYGFKTNGWKLGDIGYSYLSQTGKVGISVKVSLENKRSQPLNKQGIVLQNGEIHNWLAGKEETWYNFSFPQHWLFTDFEEELKQGKILWNSLPAKDKR